MDAEKETVSVKWWNHRSALCRAIKELYMKSLYADVRIDCEGTKHWAHKFVLSACSEYFEEELANTPHGKTLVLSSEVREKEFLLLLDFMYLGVVEVLQEDLPELVQAAEKLMIRGLAVPYDGEESDHEHDYNSKGRSLSSKKSEEVEQETQNSVSTEYSNKRKRIEEESEKDLVEVKVEVDEFEDGTESLDKTEPLSTDEGTALECSPDQNCLVTSTNADVNAQANSGAGVNSMLKVIFENASKRGRKKVVKMTDPIVKKENIQKDSEIFTCLQCSKTFQWRSNLTKHMRTHTGEKPYSCNLCSYKTSYSEALKRHQRTHSADRPSRHTPRSKNSTHLSVQDEQCLVINEYYSISDKESKADLCKEMADAFSSDASTAVVNSENVIT